MIFIYIIFFSFWFWLHDSLCSLTNQLTEFAGAVTGLAGLNEQLANGAALNAPARTHSQSITQSLALSVSPAYTRTRLLTITAEAKAFTKYTYTLVNGLTELYVVRVGEQESAHDKEPARAGE